MAKRETALSQMERVELAVALGQLAYIYRTMAMDDPQTESYAPTLYAAARRFEHLAARVDSPPGDTPPSEPGHLYFVQADSGGAGGNTVYLTAGEAYLHGAADCETQWGVYPARIGGRLAELLNTYQSEE